MVQKRTSLKNSKLARRRKKRAIGRLILYSSFFVSILLGLSFLSSADFLSIKVVEVVNKNQSSSLDEIANLVEQKLQGKILKIFSRTNVFLYPKGEITAEILNHYPKVAMAEVSLRDFSILEIKVEEREPFGFWCRDIIEVIEEASAPEELGESVAGGAERRVSEECFYFDQSGFIFAPSVEQAENPNGSFVRYYSQISGNPIGLKIITDENQFNHLQKFLSLMNLYGAETKEVFLKLPEIEVKASDGVKIIWDIRHVPEKIFENFITIAEDPEFRNGIGLSSFEYIDLRFGNKILYKLK